MKNIIYIAIMSLTLITTTVYASPPYLSVDVGSGSSFDTESCLKAAHTVLKQDGFEKTMRTDSTVFAAYKEGNQYQYKVLVRCMTDTGTVIVVVVADTLKTIKSKAQQLRSLIQQRLQQRLGSSKKVQTLKAQAVQKNNEIPKEEADDELQTVNAWKTTKLSTARCLKKAELSLKNSGFSNEVTTEKSEVTGKNDTYEGTIKCVPKEKVVLFSVTGKKLSVTESLLTTLQDNF